MSAALRPVPPPRPLHWPPLVFALRDMLRDCGQDIYVVGGAVRDALWGVPAHDIDLVVAEGAFHIARTIADRLHGAFYKLDPERETGRAIIETDGGRTLVDVALFRGAGLLDDLKGRDFTLNAMAAPLQALDTVIDPLGGLGDAQHRILRRCTPDSIASDPLRALRAARLSVRFNLRIEPATLADIRREGHRMMATSAERIRDEFMALLAGPRPAAGLRVLDALGLLTLVVPETEAMRGVEQDSPQTPDVWQHTLLTIERLHDLWLTISPQRTESTAAEAGLGMIVYYLDRFRPHLQAHLDRRWADERPHHALLTLAALLHDSGKPATRQERGGETRFPNHESVGAELAERRGRALRLSKQEVARLRTIVRQHTRPHRLDHEGPPSRRAIYRFWRDCGMAGVDVCLLALADYLALAGPTLSTDKWSHFLQTIGALLENHYQAEGSGITALPPLVDGHDLMQALNLLPGPHIGELLEHIREAQAAGEVRSREEALALARKHLQD